VKDWFQSWQTIFYLYRYTSGIFFDPKVVEGVRRLFFTKVTGEKIKERGTDGIKASMKNYKPLMPPKSIDSVQQGGTVVGRYYLNAVDPSLKAPGFNP
jgi:hypothetical protein